ncbi:MAG: ABC transporter permease [Lachnospiraceae bacterium]|jgi:taurine transport system permease protein|nr:ABC transporter permease [Lachnospiraceae bacterium]
MVRVDKKGRKGEFKELTAKDVVYMVLPVISIAFLLLLWYLVSSRRPDMFPTMEAAWKRLMLLMEKPVMRVSYLGHILYSLKRVVLALLSAIILGLAFGIVIGWNKKLDCFFGTVFNVIRPIPPIAWVPLITIAFGIGEFSKVLVVFISAFMPIVVNTRASIQNVEEMYLDVGTLFDASKSQMLWEVAMPSAIPGIIAGIKTATSAAWMAVLAAEMLGAKSGVGFLVSRGMDGNDMALVLVAMITIGVIGALLSVFTSFVERLLCPWMKIK